MPLEKTAALLYKNDDDYCVAIFDEHPHFFQNETVSGNFYYKEHGSVQIESFEGTFARKTYAHKGKKLGTLFGISDSKSTTYLPFTFTGTPLKTVPGANLETRLERLADMQDADEQASHLHTAKNGIFSIDQKHHETILENTHADRYIDTLFSGVNSPSVLYSKKMFNEDSIYFQSTQQTIDANNMSRTKMAGIILATALPSIPIFAMAAIMPQSTYEKTAKTLLPKNGAQRGCYMRAYRGFKHVANISFLAVQTALAFHNPDWIAYASTDAAMMLINFYNSGGKNSSGVIGTAVDTLCAIMPNARNRAYQSSQSLAYTDKL